MLISGGSCKTHLALPSLILVFFTLASCASIKTQQQHYKEVMPYIEKGEYEKASIIIEEAKDSFYQTKDRVLYYLDLGMLYHWAGKYRESNEMLSLAEEGIEELFTLSISKQIFSGVLNDNVLDYSGEDYEDIYLNVFKALNYIALDEYESALVEARRIQIKLNLMEDRYIQLIDNYNQSEDIESVLSYPEIPFHNDVLARYISVLLHRAAGSVADARIDLELMNKAWNTQKSIYNFPKPEFPAPEQKKNALVNVIAFSGLTPVKLAETIYFLPGYDSLTLVNINQSEDYAEKLSDLAFIPVPGVMPGAYFKLQFPHLESRSSEADRVLVKVNGKVFAELALLENMDKIARETFQVKQPLIIIKTLMRAVLKNIAKEIGKQAIQSADSEYGALLSLLFDVAATVTIEVTENADLRLSQFFPSHARVVEFSIEPGTYNVAVEYWNGNRFMEAIDYGRMEFRSNELNLIESFIPY